MRISLLVLFLAITILSPLHLLGQNNPRADSLTTKEFNRVIETKFSTIINGGPQNSLGNFVSVDIIKNSIEFAPSLKIGSGAILSIRAKGGLSDNVLSLSSNSTLSNNVGISTEIHFLNRSSVKNIVRYTASDNLKFQQSKNKINLSFEKDSLRLLLKVDESESKLRIKKLGLKVSKAKIELEKEIDPLIQDSFVYAIKLLQLEISQEQERLKDITSTGWKYRQKLSINNDRIIKTDSLNRLIVLTGFNTSWVSFSYGVRNDAFKLFNSDLIFDDQITDISYTSHQFSVQLNSIKLDVKPFSSRYSSLGIFIRKKSNLEDLDGTKIIEIERDTNTIGEIREVKTEVSAFTGEFKKDINSVEFRIDDYRFFGTGNRFALHAFPNIILSDGKKPQYNFGIGIFLSLPKKEKETSLFNSEIFYEFKDLFNSSNKGTNAIQENSIGLRLTFPLYFNSLIN